MVTAVLGALIFSEKLPGVWWLGAAMLCAGSVIIGMREEGEKKADAPLLDSNGEPFRDEDEEGDRVELRGVENEREETESSDEDGVLK